MTISGAAVVTGGTSEIGQAIVRALAAAGNDVAILFHSRADRAERLADELSGVGRRALAAPVDVAELGKVRAAFARVTAELGPPLTLVNCAAAVRFERFMASDPADWQRQIDVTLIGCLNCSRVAAEEMVAAGQGRIVNVVAEGALVGEPALAVATAAKAGVVGLTRTLARELAPHGVTVNAVSPGFVPTDSVPRAMLTPERLARITAHYPAGRLGTPRDIAATTAFLCSDDASYVTGQTISVSGGYSGR